MSEHKGQNYLHGAAILTAGVIIMKILGFLYKMPIGNILGDDGYSMFLATYNVYNVFLTLSTAATTLAMPMPSLTMASRLVVTTLALVVSLASLMMTSACSVCSEPSDSSTLAWASRVPPHAAIEAASVVAISAEVRRFMLMYLIGTPPVPVRLDDNQRTARTFCLPERGGDSTWLIALSAKGPGSTNLDAFMVDGTKTSTNGYK